MTNNISICRINKEACTQFHEIIGLNKINDGNLYIIGIYKGSALIGFLSYYDEGEILLFNKVYIEPDFRSNGYGILLVEKLKEIAAKVEVDILAKVFNAKELQANKTLEFLSKCGFGSATLKSIYYIIDLHKTYQFFYKKKFGDSRQIINEEYKILSYKEIKDDANLFAIIKKNSEEFNSFSYLEEKRENVHESFFVHDNDVLGWFVFELKSGDHIQIDSLFSNPKYRYSIIGFRFFKLLIDQCFASNPNAKTVSFNLDPSKRNLSHAYDIIFKESILNVVKVWYSYYFVNEN